MSEMGRKGILSRLMWNEELFKKLRWWVLWILTEKVGKSLKSYMETE
jgi:hypothetical protein